MGKYIDADRLKQTIADNVYPVQDAFNSRDYGMFWTGGIEKAIDEAPAADVVEVVRCKDCKYGDTGTDEIGRQFYKCIGIHYGGVSPTDYCSYGERKDG